MTVPGNLDVRHPRLRMHGPHVVLPALGEDFRWADLPFADDGGSPGHRGPWVVLATMAAASALAGGVVVARHDGGRAATELSTPVAEPTMPLAPTATTSTTTEASATTTSTTAVPPPVTVPVDQLPPHEAVYRDGRLILQGTLPNPEVAERFRAEAAAVIGADNVIVQYQYDPRVPEPTDGRVRVDEQFVFATGSAEVDPAYFSVFDLGVAVMKLNPQATMRIRGYTDDRGSLELNLRLSRERAGAAAYYLAANGIDPARVVVEGLGPADPVAPNDTEEGRTQNRRIEVDLFNLLA